MSVRVGFLLACLASVALFVPGCAGEPTASTDSRERLLLPPAGRDQVLAEMRILLESLDGIIKGVAADDLAAVQSAARASGTAMAADMDPEVQAFLPPPFLDLGMRTHRAFDELAADVAAGASKERVLQALAGITGNCVGCHAAYRLDEQR